MALGGAEERKCGGVMTIEQDTENTCTNRSEDLLLGD